MLFLVPMLALVLWPRRWRLRARGKTVLKSSLAATAAVVAVILALAIPSGAAVLPRTLALSPESAGTVQTVGRIRSR